MQNFVNSEARSDSGLFMYTHTLLNNILDLVFPPRCGGCGRVDTDWCESCAAELSRVPIILQERILEPDIPVAATGMHTGKLQDAVQALKYYQARKLAPQLAERIVRILNDLNWSFDTIIPIPMHAARLHERGYNQAQLIAEAVAYMLGQTCTPDLIFRTRQTQSQVGLTALERQSNVAGAFNAHSELIQGKHILIIDDVLTTGSTIRACAEVALHYGAASVYGITVSAAQN